MQIEVVPLADGQVDDVLAVLPLHRLDQGDGRYLVAWEAGAPVGHLHLTTGSPPEAQDLTVVESARGRGIGTALLAAAEAACRERGDDCLAMEVSEANGRARALYGRLGYLASGAAPRRVRGPVAVRGGTIEVDDTLLRLVKRLRPSAPPRRARGRQAR